MSKKSLNFYFIALNVVCVVALLSGCTLLPSNSIPAGLYADDYPVDTNADTHADTHTENNQTSNNETSSSPTPLLYTINDYVRNLTQDLVANMEQITSLTPLGITHFAWLDSDLHQSNVMALQMAEGFKHEFHQYRIPVVDFKSTGFIRVTAQGDFYLSRDHDDLNFDVPMDYILTGTFALHRGGVLINARVIDVSTKHIVASAQSLIPAHIASAVMVSYENVIGEHFELLGLPPQL